MPWRPGKSPRACPRGPVDAARRRVRNRGMQDPTDTYNWLRLDDRTTSSGQPSEAQLAAIAALGVRCVINLAPHAHAKALPDEAASVRALGMDYVNIPVDFRAPTEADFAAFVSAMARLEGQAVHVHCAANYRVSAFLARYRRDLLGLPDAMARAHIEGIWVPDAIWSEFIDRRA